MVEDKTEGGRISAFIKTILIALALAFVLKSLLFQPFRIPSISMEPNLVEGDVVIVSKYAYGYGPYAANPLHLPLKARLFSREPKRGDLVVFYSKNEKTYYVKRLVGLPGDKVQIKAGRVFINDKEQRQIPAPPVAIQGLQSHGQFYEETFDGAEGQHLILDTQIGTLADDTDVYTVPNGSYFVLGDNRDRSLDSRFVRAQGGPGMVSADSLVGRAEFILLSVKEGASIRKPWTWGRLRTHRFFKGLG